MPDLLASVLPALAAVLKGALFVYVVVRVAGLTKDAIRRQDPTP